VDKIIFCINDVALLTVTIECFLFAILLLVKRGRKISHVFLAVFLVSIGLDTIDTLVYWCPPISLYTAQLSPYLFLIFKFSVLVSPPALYLYTKSIVYKNYQFTRKELYHFAPALAFPMTVVLIGVSMGEEIYTLSPANFDILFYNPFFHLHLWVRNILCITYTVLSYQLLKNYRTKLLENYSNTEGMEHKWLTLLLGGYFLIWGSIFLAYMCHIIGVSASLGNITGTATNYCTFVFLNTIVFYGLNMSIVCEGAQLDDTKKAISEIQHEVIDDEHIALVTQAMIQDQLFLQPEITLEELAQHLSLPDRHVSSIINRHFQKNFFEFINFYRVEYAKKLIETIDQGNTSILDVMLDSGFNSKSAFNRYFKKYTDSLSEKKYVAET
jgi:AraC-like DNA-binding protein